MSGKLDGACVICGKHTMRIVGEPNICKNLPLCEECEKQFEQCQGCGGHYDLKELEGGYCSNCR